MQTKDGATWMPTMEQIEKWAQAYPQVEIEQELLKMDCWLEANPSRRKTKRGMPKFINSWLNRAEQNKKTVNQSTSTRHTTLYEDLNDTSWAR